MPSGQTHDRVNTGILLLCIIAYLHCSGYGITSLVAIFSLSYLFATFFLSPDLDIESSSHKAWGILKILWWPYKKFMKHRGWSHHPIMGPFTLIANLLIYLAIIVYFTGFDVNSVPHDYYLVSICGMVLSIEVHILTDKVIFFKKETSN